MRPISPKRRSQIQYRQTLRLQHLSEMPWCEVGLAGHCRVTATDVHEIINRSQRSTAWLEPDLFVSACRPCHAWITGRPLWAQRHGYHLKSWQHHRVERAREIRGTCRDKECTLDHLEAE